MFGGLNSFPYKLLYSYIPMAIGISVEPILVAVATSYCMLAPYEKLRRRNSPSKHSLSVDYDKSPPHFQLARTVRAGDIGLAALTTAILLSNVLAVAVSGLFSLSYADFNISHDIETTGVPVVKGDVDGHDWEIFYPLVANLSNGRDLPTWTTKDSYIFPFYPVSGNDVQIYEGNTFGVSADISCRAFRRDNFFLNPSPSASGHAELDLTLLMDFDGCSKANNGHSTTLISLPSDDIVEFSDRCSQNFFAVWVEQPGNPHPGNSLALNQNYLDAAGVSCTFVEKVYQLTATINDAHQVLKVTNVRPLNAGEIAVIYPANISTPGDMIRAVANAITPSDFAVGTHSRLVWVNFFMALLAPSIIRQLPNVTHVPNTTSLASTFQDVFQRLFAVSLRLYAEEIFSMGESSVSPGTAIVLKPRVKVNFKMFVLTAVILVYTIVVLVAVYTRQRPHIYGYLPTSLSGMYALLYASNAKEYCGSGSTPAERALTLSGTYAYGSFIGVDGRRHYGVNRESEQGGGVVVEEKKCS